MPAITVTDLTNAKLDVDHIADIATSTDPTATDRLGNTKATMAGAIATISTITNRGAWSSGEAYAVKDTVFDAGTWYICVVAHTAGATFAGDVANWRVYQGVIADDLASADGVLLVGNAADKRDLAAASGAGLVGSDDGASGSLWTTAAGFIARSRALEENESADSFGTIAALARAGKLKLAILGDSTAAGVGAGGGAYGECNEDSKAGFSAFWFWSLMNADPAFVGADNTYLYYRRNSTIDNSSLSAAFPHYNLVYSNTPVTPVHRLAYPNGSLTTDNLTVYFSQRTAAGAARFELVAIDADTAAEISRTTIDTYTPQVTFGGAGSFDVGLRMAKQTITLPSAVSKVNVKIENLTLVDRGGGVAADGTANVYGFALGEGVDVRNFAVASTTLLNGSAANITRGVTTTERIQKAYDMAANAVVLNWATNDSKAGVSTPAAFKADLIVRINELRAYLPDMAIVLATTATGSAGSIYENNPAYFSVLRDVALEMGCGLLDGERILAQLTRADVVADDVHPNERGDKLLADILAAKTGAEYPAALPPRSTRLITGEYDISGASGVSDFTGNWVLLGDISIGNVRSPAQLVARAQINLYRAAAEIPLCELALDFSNAAGGAYAAASSVRVSVARIPAASGDAWGQIVEEKIMTSGVFFTGGPYYLKVWAKNFSLRTIAKAARINWRFEKLPE